MENPIGSMAEIRKGNPDAHAYHTRLFSHQFEVFKRIAGDDWRSASPATKKTRKKMLKKYAELENILNKEIEDFSKLSFAKSNAIVSERVVSLTIFMYLCDVLEKLHHATLKENKIGLYHLFDSVSAQLFGMLSADYFERPYKAIIRNYLLLEPSLMACADLAGVEVVTIQKAVRLNQPKLSKRVESLVSSRKKRTTRKTRKKQKHSKKSKHKRISKKRKVKKGKKKHKRKKR